MADDLVKTLDLSPEGVTVVNTTTQTEVYRMTDRQVNGVIGGSMGDDKSLRLQAQLVVSLADASADLIVGVEFGGALVAEVDFGASAGLPLISGGLMVEAFISNLGGPSIQKMHVVGSIAIAPGNQTGLPVSQEGGTEDTGNDTDVSMYVKWNNASTGNKVTKQFVSLELLGEPEVLEPAGASEPLTQLLSVSLLNKLPTDLYKDVVFYGEFFHHLDFAGVGVASVARATAQNATWRDGGAHSVAANKPRFEYSGPTPLGLLINSGVSETLTIDPLNDLDNANTLFWRENNVTKYTTAQTNPFNNSGLWTGTDNIHISQIMKFNRVLSAVEIARVQIIYSNYQFGVG